MLATRGRHGPGMCGSCSHSGAAVARLPDAGLLVAVCVATLQWRLGGTQAPAAA